MLKIPSYSTVVITCSLVYFIPIHQLSHLLYPNMFRFEWALKSLRVVGGVGLLSRSLQALMYLTHSEYKYVTIIYVRVYTIWLILFDLEVSLWPVISTSSHIQAERNAVHARTLAALAHISRYLQEI